MTRWAPPRVVELQVGMEIGAYAPAELDFPSREPPREPSGDKEGATPQVRQETTALRAPA